MSTLLSRDAFREAVFARDEHKCVVCGEPAVDAHHIIERRLWPDGGYYVDNGASLCATHHWEAESTKVTVEAVREAAGITHPIIPPHLYSDNVYDKWGNIILPNGTRIAGELMGDESVRKVLRDVLGDFSDKVKYPRTYHLPWSENITDDDRVMESLVHFEGQHVVVTEKMDGENTSLYRSGTHARSIDGRSHPSRSWVKGMWARIAGDIPEGWRVCGENLYAVHSITYEKLPTYFMGFSIWDDTNTCLSWEDTLEWFALLDITPVPVLYEGPWDENVIRSLPLDTEAQEGYVVRLSRAFAYGEFRQAVGKYVRKDHVRTQKHWFYGQPVIPQTIG